MSLLERRPALAESYKELIKRIRHTGTVIVPLSGGRWYHSGDPAVVKAKIKKIKSILYDTYIKPKLSTEEAQFEKFLAEENKV